jgi:cell division septation protein DedD
MIIFISSPDCQRCDAAWNAFTKDASAVNTNVSTRVDLQNFDGKVIADMFEAGNAPAWIVLDANGKMISKWNGGWKDASGNPTVYIEPEGVIKPKMTETPKSSPSTPVATGTTTDKPAYSPPSAVSKTEPAKFPSSTTTETAANSTIAKSGFVLQAGYFGSEANAQKCIADMKTKGCGEYVIKTNMKDGTTFYRVISKSYPSESEATAAMQEAAIKGAKVAVKRAAEL